MDDNKQWLTVIGIGPGSEKFLTPAAREAAGKAEVLVGGKTALTLFRELTVEKRVINGSLEQLFSFLVSIRGKRTAVLVSGDPGFYSLLGWLNKKFPGETAAVIPGISSMQLAFARMGRSWEDCTFVSVHGRQLEVLDSFLDGLMGGSVKLAVLSGGDNTPSRIGSYFSAKGLANLNLWVGTNLEDTGEWTCWLTAAELAERDIYEKGVVIAGYEPD